MDGFGQKWLILLALILVTGCAVRPVETELPVSHPANVQAGSAPFTPPVNVFSSNESFTQTPPSSDSSMIHKQPGKTAGKPMGHQKDPMKMKTKPSNMPGMEKTGSEHREHSQ